MKRFLISLSAVLAFSAFAGFATVGPTVAEPAPRAQTDIAVAPPTQTVSCVELCAVDNFRCTSRCLNGSVLQLTQCLAACAGGLVICEAGCI